MRCSSTTHRRRKRSAKLGSPPIRLPRTEMLIRLRRSNGTITITTTAPKKTRIIDFGRGRLYPESPSPERNSGLIALRTKTLDASRPIHVAISGAAGRVAYALLFRIANGGLFGKEQAIALGLLDLPERLDLLE